MIPLKIRILRLGIIFTGGAAVALAAFKLYSVITHKEFFWISPQEKLEKEQE